MGRRAGRLGTHITPRPHHSPTLSTVSVPGPSGRFLDPNRTSTRCTFLARTRTRGEEGRNGLTSDPTPVQWRLVLLPQIAVGSSTTPTPGYLPRRPTSSPTITWTWPRSSRLPHTPLPLQTVHQPSSRAPTLSDQVLGLSLSQNRVVPIHTHFLHPSPFLPLLYLFSPGPRSLPISIGGRYLNP